MAIIIVSYILLLLIVSGIGIIRYKKLTMPFKVLTLSVIVTFSLAILSRAFVLQYKNNAPILHLECITGYDFYSLTYYYLFKNRIIKKLIIISIVLITAFFFVNAMLLQPFHSVFPTNLDLPTQILFAIFSLLLFKEMLLYPSKINIIKQSVFWYNTAILFYATIMFFIFGLSNYFSEHKIYDHILYYFWYLVLYVFHILIGVSLLTENKKIPATDAR